MNLKEQKIVVTGADGFIGSHLTEELVRAGCQVRALVYYNSFNSWGWLDTLPSEIQNEIEIVSGDVRDSSGVRALLADRDVVFHLAAMIGIPYSYQAPASYIDVNVTGTLNVLQAAHDLKLKRVVVTSTSEVYGTAQQIPIDENHPRQGQSPYSASKIGGDALAESYYRSFKLPVTIVRPFNTYGPRQSARAIIPTIITQLLAGAREIKLGALSPTRDFVYVQDTVRAFLAAAECENTIGGEFNVASGREISMGELANKICDLVGSAAKILSDEERIRPAGSEVERLLGSSRRLQQATGWEPGLDLEAGLAKTIEWFRDENNRRQYKSNIYNV